MLILILETSNFQNGLSVTFNFFLHLEIKIEKKLPFLLHGSAGCKLQIFGHFARSFRNHQFVENRNAKFF
jgi:hypothetical protein